MRPLPRLPRRPVLLPATALADVVVSDDQIVQGSGRFGFDCCA